MNGHSIFICWRFSRDKGGIPLSFPTYTGILANVAAGAARQLNLSISWQAHQVESTWLRERPNEGDSHDYAAKDLRGLTSDNLVSMQKREKRKGGGGPCWTLIR